MKVVLYQPQIPQNAGNIVRTCKVTGSDLILVKPLGFSISNKALKRAGLDYWDGVNVLVIDDLIPYLETCDTPFYFLSSKASIPYTEISFRMDTTLIFGSETAGLDPIFLERWPERFCTVPMKKDSRCLNLANTVSIVIYEGWRQQGFSGR